MTESNDKQEETTYYSVHVIQEDKRPIALFRWQESAKGFVEMAYRRYGTRYKITKVKLNTKYLEEIYNNQEV